MKDKSWRKMRAFWDTKAYLDIYINRRQFWREKHLELFWRGGDTQAKKFNRRRMMEWRYHQAIYQKWSEASLTNSFFIR